MKKKLLVGLVVGCVTGVVVKQVLKNKNNGEIVINKEEI